MGLGAVTESGLTYLSLQGGLVWDKKADSTHPAYYEQAWEDKEGVTKWRKGARYAHITGTVVNVEFKTHAEFGENINVTIDDADDNRYVVAVGTNNRYSQDIMKALLIVDIEKPIMIKPYAFPDSKNPKKTVQGCTIYQGGDKLKLEVEGAPTQPEAFFKSGDQKKIRRFFEDLTDWYIAFIKESIIPNFKPLQPKEGKPVENKPKATPAPTTETEATTEAPAETPTEAPAEVKTSTPKAPSTLAMKKALRAYSAEHYGGRELPADLAGEELVSWYNKTLTEDELPFEDEEEETQAPDSSNVPRADIASQLDALKG